MAKLSARGATVTAKWRRTVPVNNGGELALTSDGRLLTKAFKGEPWKLAGRGYDLARATDYARLRGYTR